jgi:hypothetical protein
VYSGVGADWIVTLDGFYRSLPGGPGCVSDNLSRGFDLAGKALWVDGNSYNNTASLPGNNGEGILCQAHGGTEWFSWALTANNGVSYMAGYDVTQYGSLIAWNKAETVGSLANQSNQPLIDAAYVQNDATVSSSGNTADLITACPSGVPQKPQGVTAETKESSFVYISWTDNSDNEIGFRVDRRIESGPWTPVAYRPRHSQGSEHNVQAWADYCAPANKELFYRVAAVGCSNDDQSAGDPVGPVLLKTQNETAAAPRVAARPLQSRGEYALDVAFDAQGKRAAVQFRTGGNGIRLNSCKSNSRGILFLFETWDPAGGHYSRAVKTVVIEQY